MVGIVIVSHSARLADGVVELAREMAGPDVAIVAAGGLDLPDRPLGTDAALIERAIDEAWADDGVLVLMDLGSAVMSAEMAAEMLPDDRRSRVLLCEAPLVEGAVAAAVAARLGDPLDQVAAEARGGLAGKVAHLASGPDGEPAPPAVEPDGAPAQEPDAASAQEPDGAPALELRITVAGRLGLHARPAARFVQTAGQFDANVTAENITAPAGPVSARSLNGVATLGVLQGHEVLVRASGPQAAQVLAALRDLADRNFDEPAESGSPPGPAAAAPSGPAAPAPSGPAAPAPSGPAAPAPSGSEVVAAGTAAMEDAVAAGVQPADGAILRGGRRSRYPASRPPIPAPSWPGWTPPWRPPDVRYRRPGNRWPPAPANSTKRASSTRTCCSSPTRPCSIRPGAVSARAGMRPTRGTAR
jgi:dihydroxyacetone kinase phosphotransfer subunit